MKYFILGTVLGMMFSCLPLFSRSASVSFYPEWAADCSSTEPIGVSPDPLLSGDQIISEPLGETVRIYGSNGTSFPPMTLGKDEIASVSGDGKFLAIYKKLGSEIEYRSISGERFWKITSMEYPYVSSHGKIVLTLVADISDVKVFDFNGTSIGKGKISGKMCTSIAFAGESDWSGAGFLDGGVYIVSDKGDILYKDKVPSGNSVKSLALSASGKVFAAHYGTTDRDGLMISMYDGKWKSRTFSLPRALHTKTALHVDEKGNAAILDGDKLFLCEKDGDLIASMNLDPSRPGHSSIVSDGRFYALSYRLKDGGSALVLFGMNGEPIMKKIFSSEPFLDCRIRGNILSARGLSTLYVWRFN
jgi:hypothetical protein